MANRARARRRQREQRYSNRLSIIGICAAVFLLMGMVGVGSLRLQAKNDSYAEREAELQSELKEEKARTAEIEKFGKYVETKEYIEDVARDKLGLVYPGEIVFKPED